MNEKAAPSTSVARFRELHASGCFVLPNPWDRGTAIALERIGYKALATTSAGAAFGMGLPDEVTAITADAMLEHIRAVARATTLPVNADFQNGYADDPEGVAGNVARCVATGAAGLSIEDGTGDPSRPLYEKPLAVERIQAARRAIDATGIPAVLTGRCEAWLVDASDPLRTALDRLAAYADAGADCLYAPGVREPAAIAEIVKAVAPKPVNVLAFAADPVFTVARLADLGVRRISVGSALSRVAWGAFLRAARAIAANGTFEAFEGMAPFDELNAMFRGRK
jgi:2-methylisocitrate lyase-like PEP mutase family enzyme